MSLKKYLSMLLISSFAAPSFAMNNGFYLGAQIGRTNLNATEATAITGEKVKGTGTGISARLLLTGVQFNPHAAMEIGYTYYAPAKYEVLSNGVSPKTRLNAIDFVGKGIFPLANSGLSVFAKAGFALTRATSSGSLAKLDANGRYGSTTQTSVRPTLGVGVSYDITQNWQTDLSFMRVMSGGGINNADFIALGITYHFVDLRCGQFLC